MAARAHSESQALPRRARLRRRFPDAGFCLKQLGRTEDARRILLKGPPALRGEPIFYYNLGCYEALLGHLQDAARYLERSFQMDSHFRAIAKKEPDLKMVQALL